MIAQNILGKQNKIMQNNNQYAQYDALALFSGGLDSILAIKMIQKQGLKVLGIHFVTPFFGFPHKKKYWENLYDIQVEIIDISELYLELLQNPTYGFGKNLNPCVDCKILLIKEAKKILPKFNASFLITGEVIGQRPMSQRRDTLDIIKRDADVKSVLLRPLCAKHMVPTTAEETGLVDREKLGSLNGRDRRGQLDLAEQYGIKEFPTPAGGCKLADKEVTGRYNMLRQYNAKPTSSDYILAGLGRQYWNHNNWLIIGRNQQDNHLIAEELKPTDYRFAVQNFPAPMAIGRPIIDNWDIATLQSAASFVASFSPKAIASDQKINVVISGRTQAVIEVTPTRNDIWKIPTKK